MENEQNTPQTENTGTQAQEQPKEQYKYLFHSLMCLDYSAKIGINSVVFGSRGLEGLSMLSK